MATRSTISLRLEDDSVKTIYCHSDGYTDEVGARLKEFYNTKEKVEALLELGDLSSLGSKLNPDSELPHSFDDRQKGVTVAYGRDRGEKGTTATIYESFDHAQKEEYNYLFIDGQWFVSENEFHPQPLHLF